MTSRLIQLPPASWPLTEHKIAILTGMSDPASCALSPSQSDFLDALPVPESWKIRRNYPWVADSSPFTPTPLWRASLSNGWHYLRARSRVHREMGARHLQALADSCEKGLILITGSCGAEILRRSLGGRAEAGKIRHVFALGPVARRPLGLPCSVIQGERDWISRPFLPDPDLVIAGFGHLDYWDHPLVSEAIRATLPRILRPPSPASVTPS